MGSAQLWELRPSCGTHPSCESYKYNPKFQVSIAEQASLSFTWSGTPKTGFLATLLNSLSDVLMFRQKLRIELKHSVDLRLRWAYS